MAGWEGDTLKARGACLTSIVALLVLLGLQVGPWLAHREPAPAQAAGADPEAAVTRAEDELLGYLQDRDPLSLDRAGEAFAQARVVSPDHPRYNHVQICLDFIAREKGSGAPPGPWRRASLDYMFGVRDPAEALAEVREDRRTGRYRDEALHQVTTGLFSEIRKDQLANLVRSELPAGALRGRTVADVGCGTGQFSVGLVDLVGPKGTVYGVDIAPSVHRVMQLAAREDPRFGRIRFVEGGSTSVNLPEGTVDVAFLMDVHCASGRRTDGDYRSRIVPWLRSVRSCLRPGGQVVVYESHPIPPLAEAMAMFEDAGFTGLRPVPIVQRFSGRAAEGYLLVGSP